MYKRPLDITIITLLHSLPPFLIIWIIAWTLIPLLIWLEDRGPVFYRQQRVGKNGKTFTMIKFRTMVVDADKIGPAWTIEGDPRITRVGRVLRKTALDELPGLLSIWRGDMSLVGPRALSTEEHSRCEKEIPDFVRRLEVRPGMTGLAQLYNHSDEPHAKLRYDLEYIDRVSLRFDLKLLAISAWYTAAFKWDGRSARFSTHV